MTYFASWTLWYLVGGAVVAVAALLLIAILLVARGIEREAERALEAARRIQENTGPIPALSGALETLLAIHHRTGAIAEKTEALAGILHGEPGGARNREWER